MPGWLQDLINTEEDGLLPYKSAFSTNFGCYTSTKESKSFYTEAVISSEIIVCKEK